MEWRQLEIPFGQEPAPAAPAKPQRVRAGWRFYGPRCGRRYELIGTGWWVIHCGHPTAIRPYYIEDPEGRMHLHPGHGRAFSLLVDAQVRAEELARGEGK